MTLTVLIPTYCRPADLSRCLDALARQIRPADQIVVITRPDDLESAAVLAEVAGVEHATVTQGGVIAAMNAGLAAATGDVIALTDDDAAPWPDWLERIERHFAADAGLGGLGGRDWQYRGEPLALDNGHETRAGTLQWWGRVIGQHHWAAAGPAREVAIVKGVNCAYRGSVLRRAGGFDTRLAGTGAQVHWELCLGLSVRRAGYKVVFDPSLGVDHFPAERFDEDQRGRFVSVAQQNAVANETLALLEHFGPLRKLVFLTWAGLVGTSAAPGLAQAIRLMRGNRPHAFEKFVATLRGRLQGLARYRRTVNSL